MESFRTMSFAKSRHLIAVCGVSLIALGGAVAWGAARSNSGVNSGPMPALAQGGPVSFAPLIARVSPAVVSIDIVGHASPSEVALQEGGGQDGGGQDGWGQAAPFFFQFPGGQGFEEQWRGQAGPQAGPRAGPWGGPRGPVPGDGRPLPKIRAAGSGFFISPDGYILTNNHVVQGADTITVHMSDGRSLPAHLVGRDPATDLAVIKVNGGAFPFVNFENAARPRVGDWVIAVGNLFGLGGTATAGIVSALGRDNVADSPLLDYMQIDAPINRGNSGGPTFDTEGRVVGVNTAIYTPSGGSVGIGFDIPADVASSISRQLIAHGSVQHGYLGATVQEITPDLAQSLGVASDAGAIVDAVSPDGPAARAGLRNGDIVTAVNGKSVHSPSEVTRLVAFSSPGARLDLNVLRDGRSLRVAAFAGVRPSEQVLARQLEGQQGDGDDDGSGDGGGDGG